MPPFQYVPFDPSALVPSIAALITRQSDPYTTAAQNIATMNARAMDSAAQGRAHAAEVSGDVWGRAITAAGQLPNQVMAQTRENANADQMRKLRQSEIDQNTVRTAQQAKAASDQQLLGSLLPQFTKPDPATGMNDVDHEGLTQAFIAKGGDPSKADAYLTTQANIAEGLAKVKASKLQDAKATASLVGAAARDAGSSDEFITSLDHSVVAGAIPTLVRDRFVQEIGQVGWDAMKSRTVKWADGIVNPITVKKDEKVAAGVSGSPLIDNTNPSEGAYTINGQRFKADGTPIGPPVPKQAEPPKLGSPEDFVTSYAKEKFGVEPAAMSVAQKAEALGAFKSANADQDMRDAALAQKNIAQALAQMQLNQQPTKEQAASVADDLVNHRISPDQLTSLFSTRGREGLAFKLAVTSEAKKMDPAFNFEEAQANYNLSKSTGFQNTVRYMDSTLESIPRLNETAATLGHGRFRTLNELSNAARTEFNSTDLKRFKTDALLVGDEIAKILSGGGTGSATSDAKLKQATDLIGQSDSVPAIAAAMEEVQTLMGNRRRALTRGTYMEKLSEPAAAAPTPTSLTPGLQRLKDRP